MALIQDFQALWFTHECVLISGVNESPYGGVGNRVPFVGRVSQSTQRVDGPMGQEEVTATTVTCSLDVPAVIGDEVELPEPFSGAWEVTSMSSHDGVPGMHPNHRKLMLTAEGGAEDSGGGGIYG